MHISVILLFIFYFTSAYQFFDISGYGVTMIDIWSAVIYIIFLKKIFWDGDKLKFVPKYHTLFLLLFILACLMSGIQPLITGKGIYLLQFLKSTLHFWMLIFFTIICAFYPIKNETWTRVIQTWLIIGLLINLFGIYQIVARAYDLPFAWLEYTNVSITGSSEMEDYKQLSLRFGNFYRATSIFSEPSALAYFNVYIISFLLIPFIQKMKPFFKSRILYVLMFISSVVALFLTFSLTGVLGLMMVFASIIFFEKYKRLFYLGLVFFIGLVVVFISDGFVKSYADVSVVELFEKRLTGILSKSSKTESTAGESYSTRLYSATQSIKIWEEHPLFGIGLGNTEHYRETEIGFSDFGILGALSETGITGFIMFLGLFLFLLLYTLKYILYRDRLSGLDPPSRRLAGIVYYIVIVQVLINFFTGNNILSFAMWFPMGMVFSIINNTEMLTGAAHKTISPVKVPLRQMFVKGMKILVSEGSKAK